MKNYNIVLMGISCASLFGISALTIGYAAGVRKKYKNICKKLDLAIDEISDAIDIDVSEKVINKAVEKAVNKRVREQVDKAVDSTIRSTKKEINDQVSLAIKAVYPDIRQSCTEKVTDEISKISSRDLIAAVREDATEKMMSKFDGELDDILERFNSELDNVSKIYSSITKKITGNDSNNLKISLS